MDRRETLGILGAAALLVLIGAGVVLGWWPLSTVLGALIATLVISIFGLLAWGFRSRARDWSEHGQARDRGRSPAPAESGTPIVELRPLPLEAATRPAFR